MCKKHVDFLVIFIGVSVKTHKPQAFVSNEATRNDTNYRMKYAFLSKETVPDYRPLDVKKKQNQFCCLVTD